ncbi:hypothetical protein BZG36_00749 [Bifiguratus adelaidae]|uniref:RING-type domain-containing protein n=1 Tax=Bifiguratus adelaidae TaxID=1938954 RepID=A0A261Y6N3_9FUNG|nr:hypothetical protein BZG36_00749 [Bifiguratus adelaidae]
MPDAQVLSYAESDLASKLRGDSVFQDAFIRFQNALKCSVCHDLLNNPQTVMECGHTFCRKCIEDELGETRRCPRCHLPGIMKNLTPNPVRNTLVHCVQALINLKTVSSPTSCIQQSKISKRASSESIVRATLSPLLSSTQDPHGPRHDDDEGETAAPPKTARTSRSVQFDELKAIANGKKRSLEEDPVVYSDSEDEVNPSSWNPENVLRIQEYHIYENSQETEITTAQEEDGSLRDLTNKPRQNTAKKHRTDGDFETIKGSYVSETVSPERTESKLSDAIHSFQVPSLPAVQRKVNASVDDECFVPSSQMVELPEPIDREGTPKSPSPIITEQPPQNAREETVMEADAMDTNVITRKEFEKQMAALRTEALDAQLALRRQFDAMKDKLESEIRSLKDALLQQAKKHV